MVNVYGKSLSLSFRLMANDQQFDAYALVSARLYSSYPTAAQIADSANDLGEATDHTTAWTSQGNGAYSVTLAAVNDSTPESGSAYDLWYVVFSFRLETGQQIQNVCKTIDIWRIDGQLSQLDVESWDLIAIESRLEHELTLPELYNKIQAAQDRVFGKIKALKLQRHRLVEYELRQAVIYKAVELCLRDLQSSGNDYKERADHWMEEFNQIWAEAEPGYDLNDDGLAEPGESSSMKSGMVFR